MIGSITIPPSVAENFGFQTTIGGFRLFLHAIPFPPHPRIGITLNGIGSITIPPIIAENF